MSSPKLSSQKIPKRGEVAQKAKDRFAAADSDPELSDSQTVSPESRTSESANQPEPAPKEQAPRQQIERRETTRASFSLYKSDAETIYLVRRTLMNAGRERYRSDIVRLALAALNEMSEKQIMALDDRVQK